MCMNCDRSEVFGLTVEECTASRIISGNLLQIANSDFVIYVFCVAASLNACHYGENLSGMFHFLIIAQGINNIAYARSLCFTELRIV